MSTELTIPRSELERALAVTTRNMHRGIALVVAGSLAAASPFLIAPMHILLIGFLAVSGITTIVIGAATLAHAKRATGVIQHKLREQQLPVARLLDS